MASDHTGLRRLEQKESEPDAADRRSRGLWLTVTRIRPALGVRRSQGQRSHLSMRRYSVLTGAALALTGLQVLLMARWLSADQFGLVVLSISATQGILQFGDLGIARLCVDSSRSPAERSTLRSQGLSVTILSTAVLIVIASILSVFLSTSDRTLVGVLVLGALAAAVVTGDKFRGARQEVAGDEVQAAGLNFIWTNAPKIGVLVGLLLFRTALAVAAVAVAVAALLAKPVLGSAREGWHAVRRVGLWASPFIAITSSFILVWSDTYFLVAHLGVAKAGSYEALYRVLGACSYFFLPLTSVITSRASVNERRPLTRPLLLSLGVTVFALALAVAFVEELAPTFFKQFKLPQEAIPGLLCYYMLLPVSYSLGAALYVRSAAMTVTRTVAVGAVVALLGHVIFTLHGGPLQAAAVAACAMGVTVVLQAIAYLRICRTNAPPHLDGEEGPDENPTTFGIYMKTNSDPQP